MNHLVDELSALLDGALAPPARAAVEAHLAGCATCRAAALAGLLVIRQQRGLELAAAAQLDLLAEYETVASVDDVETAEDAALIAALDTLDRGGTR